MICCPNRDVDCGVFVMASERLLAVCQAVQWQKHSRIRGDVSTPCFRIGEGVDPSIMRKSGDLIRAIDLEGLQSAADRLGVSRQRIHQLIGDNTLDYYQFGKRKMVHKRDIDKLIVKRQAKAS